MRKLGLLALFALWFSAPAFANFPGSAYVGAELGYGMIMGGGGTDLNYGLILGYAPTVNFSIGGFYDYIPRGTIQDDEGNQTSGSIKVFGGEFLYNLPFWQGGAFGARVGYGTSDTEFDGSSESNSGLYFGPKLNYDLTLSSGASADFSVYYLLTSANNSSNILGATAAIRFWF